MNWRLFIWHGIWNKQKASPEETEELVVKKLPFDEAYEMVESGMITDAMSVAAIQQIQIMIYQGEIKKIKIEIF